MSRKVGKCQGAPDKAQNEPNLAATRRPSRRVECDPSCSAHSCIGSTPQGVWLQRNAHRFGFVLRYEGGYRSVTGYNGEPWHFRYVGTALSTAYHSGGWHTLEQFLAEPAAPTY